MDIQKLSNAITPVIAPKIAPAVQAVHSGAEKTVPKILSTIYPYRPIKHEQNILEYLCTLCSHIESGKKISFESKNLAQEFQYELIKLFQDKSISKAHIDAAIKKLNSSLLIEDIGEGGFKFINSQEYMAASGYADEIFSKGKNAAEKAKISLAALLKHLDKEGKIIEQVDGTTFTTRIKGRDGILKKLVRIFNDGGFDKRGLSLDSAKKLIGDYVGCRLQIADLSENSAQKIILNLSDESGKKLFKSFAEFKDEIVLYMAGKSKREYQVELALRKLKEKQTEKILATLLKGIEEGRISMHEVSNYGDEISSYFTAGQIKKLIEAREDRIAMLLDGHKSLKDPRIPIKIKGAKSIPQQNKFKLFKMPVTFKLEASNDPTVGDIRVTRGFSRLTNIHPEKAVKESGYSSLHIDMKKFYKSAGTCNCELQIRGNKLHMLGEVEHDIYDCLQGKIEFSDPKKGWIARDISKLSPEGKKLYLKYIQDLYQWSRLSELGIKLPEPVFDSQKIKLDAANYSYKGLCAMAEYLRKT